MTFSKRPDEDKVRCPYEILRCRPGNPLVGIVVSNEWTGANLHWWGGKSVLHRADDCPACDAGNTYRWYGYFLGVPNGLRVVSIFEFTSRCYQTVADYYADYGTLRGAPFQLRRTGKNSNAPLALAFSEKRVSPSSLPEGKPLEPILARLWERNYLRSLEKETEAGRVTLTNRIDEVSQVQFKRATDNGR